MTDEARPHDGGCTCGAVRYRMTTRPLFVHCCHCRWCQRETGASFALNALIEADRVTVLKGVPEVVTPRRTVERARRYRAVHSAASLYGAITREQATPFALCASAPSKTPIACRPTFISIPHRSSPGSYFHRRYPRWKNTTSAPSIGRRIVWNAAGSCSPPRPALSQAPSAPSRSLNG